MRAAVLIVVSSAAVASAPAAADPGQGRERVRVLGQADEGVSPSYPGVSFSANGRRFAYVARRDDDRRVVVVDGAVVAEADEVRDLRFAGRHLVYRAKQEGAWRVVYDGVAGPPFRDVAELSISDDGAHVTYTARTRAGVVVVHDGVAGEPWDQVGDLVVAGSRWAYVGHRDRAEHAVVDGVASEGFLRVQQLLCSRDGERCAYLANRVDAGQVVVADGQRWPMDGGAIGGDLVFTGDGTRLAWWERRGEDTVVLVDGQPTPAVPFIEQIAVSRTGEVATVSEDTRRRQFVVPPDFAHAIAHPRYFEVDSLTWSPDGARLAYRVNTARSMHYVVDGVVGPGHEDAIEGGFSPDGRRFAYHAYDDRRWHMIVDGVRGASTDLATGGLGLAVWSPDGRHVAYFVLDGDAAVVLDGQRVSRVWHAVDLRWIDLDKGGDARPGGRHLAFGHVDLRGAISWRVITP